jgi:Protein of unknown function (DUF2934)
MASRRTPVTSNPADPLPPADLTSKQPPPRARKSPLEPGAPAQRVKVTPDARYRLIAESAYLRAERRGFAPGHEVQDWLAAEAEIDALLKAGGGSPQ